MGSEIVKKENGVLTNGGQVMSIELAEKLMTKGDLSGLSAPQKMEYYKYMCDQNGLDVASRPFEFMVLDGKTVLYARKECAELLRRKHNISVVSCDTKQSDGFIVTTCIVKELGTGRTDCGVGAVCIKGETNGKVVANAIMKSETKAKRRATLSICGIGFLDESELDTVSAGSSPADDAPCKSQYLLQLKKQEPDKADAVAKLPITPEEVMHLEKCRQLYKDMNEVEFANAVFVKLNRWPNCDADDELIAKGL